MWKRAVLPFVVAVSSISSAGCDGAKTYEDCAAATAMGTGEARCMPSTFTKEDKLARDALGRVWVGTETAAKALVRMEPAGAFAHDETFAPVTVTSDDSGLYFLGPTPFRYDVLARIDRDVVCYRDVGYRYIDIAVDRDAPIRAWTGRVDLAVTYRPRPESPVVQNAPRPGNALAFFTGGAKVAGIRGSLAEGLTVATRLFDAEASIFVIEYPVAQGLIGAVAYGRVDHVMIKSGRSVPASVTLYDLPRAPRATVVTKVPSGITTQDIEVGVGGMMTTSFVANVPSGFVAEDVEVSIDFGLRTNEALVARVPLGTNVDLPPIPDAGWSARVRATRAGAVVSSGRRYVPTVKNVALPLFDVPVVLSPAPGAVAEGGTVSARAAGVMENAFAVVEHVFTPESGDGSTIHVVTTALDATVPDLTPLGLPRASGRYVWTVRAFPELGFADFLSGIDARIARPMSASAPRTIVLP